jgi:flagellar protein FliJ
MAQFKFALQPVLNYRQQIVEQRQQELGQLESELQHLREGLETIIQERLHLLDHMKSAQRGGKLDCGDILSQLAYQQDLERKREAQQVLIAEQLVKTEAKRAELLTAVQEKQTLEKLKERQLAEHVAEIDRQERNLLDEMSVIRFRRDATQEIDRDD